LHGATSRVPHNKKYFVTIQREVQHSFSAEEEASHHTVYGHFDSLNSYNTFG
jgi:hypothetical protein